MPVQNHPLLKKEIESIIQSKVNDEGCLSKLKTAIAEYIDTDVNKLVKEVCTIFYENYSVFWALLLVYIESYFVKNKYAAFFYNAKFSLFFCSFRLY